MVQRQFVDPGVGHPSEAGFVAAGVIVGAGKAENAICFLAVAVVKSSARGGRRAG